MALYCRRITAGARDLDRSIWLRQSSRSADISRLPLNYVNQQRPGMVLRSRLLVVGAVGTGGTRDGDEKEVSPCSYAVGDLAEKSGSEDQRVEEDGDRASRDRTVKVAVAAAAMVVLGVGNRVLYKLALVPLKHYPFFLAQLATFGYVVVYFSILYLRYHAGIVTDEMLSMRKAPFLAVGLLEALGAATGMAARAILSGASIPILSQTFLVWQILLSIIFLGRRCRVNQLLGCFFVAVGVIITVASGSSAGHSLKEAGIFWSLLMIVSFLFQAADTVLKEVIFLDAARNLKAFFICLLLPFLSILWGIPFSQLPNYLKDGTACFLNIDFDAKFEEETEPEEAASPEE